jgi:hypothetical protein
MIRTEPWNIVKIKRIRVGAVGPAERPMRIGRGVYNTGLSKTNDV